MIIKNTRKILDDLKWMLIQLRRVSNKKNNMKKEKKDDKQK